MFKNAKIVDGAHGAGLTNICFSQSGSKIIEISINDKEIKLNNL